MLSHAGNVGETFFVCVGVNGVCIMMCGTYKLNQSFNVIFSQWDLLKRLGFHSFHLYDSITMLMPKIGVGLLSLCYTKVIMTRVQHLMHKRKNTTIRPSTPSS